MDEREKIITQLRVELCEAVEDKALVIDSHTRIKLLYKTLEEHFDGVVTELRHTTTALEKSFAEIKQLKVQLTEKDQLIAHLQQANKDLTAKLPPMTPATLKKHKENLKAGK